MAYKFEKLKVWQLARQFVKLIYKISKDFPDDERFGLISQIKRAVVSIMLNIAEGSERKSDVEFVRFLRIAYTSMLEVISACYIALDQGYISQERFDFVYKSSNILGKKMNALIKSINKSTVPNKEASQ